MQSAAAIEEFEQRLDAKLDEEIAARWRRGELAEMKLDPHQLRVYKKYRAWEAEITALQLVASVQEREKQRGVQGMIRLFVLDIGRRWGKTFLVALIMIEDLIRNAGWVKTYATAHLVDMTDLIIPMIDEIIEDAPPDVRPIYRMSSRGLSRVYLFPKPEGQRMSVLKLIGIDNNPRKMRGKASHGFAVTEAGHVRNLAHTIGTIVYPQFQRHRQATLILESNAPEDPEHDFDRVFIPDAEARGAYVKETIDDNEAISPFEKEEFLAAAVAATSVEDMEREYYGKRNRSPKKMVCAEFDIDRHVVPAPARPRYARAFTVLDPGEMDPLGLLWGYWDFGRAKLVIVRSYAESNMRTPAAAEMVVCVEQEQWGMPRTHGPEELNKRVRHTTFHHSKGWKFEAPNEALTYWDGTMFKPNPCNRVSDIDAHFIGDLAVLHDVSFNNAEKSNKEAAEGEMRTAFLQDRIEIVEDSGPLAMQLQRGTWRLDSHGRRVDWNRHPALGHLDCVSCLIYMWRDVQHYRYLNPDPPTVTDLRGPNVAAMPWHADVKREPVDGLGALRKALRPQRRLR